MICGLGGSCGLMASGGRCLFTGGGRWGLHAPAPAYVHRSHPDEKRGMRVCMLSFSYTILCLCARRGLYIRRGNAAMRRARRVPPGHRSSCLGERASECEYERPRKLNFENRGESAKIGGGHRATGRAKYSRMRQHTHHKNAHAHTTGQGRAHCTNGKHHAHVACAAPYPYCSPGSLFTVQLSISFSYSAKISVVDS